MPLRSIRGMVRGIPYSHNKKRGDLKEPRKWTSAVIEQTKDLPEILGPCILRVTLLLPASHIPADYPYGNDLDNLLKRFWDALKQTVLRHAPGDDGAIISLEAAKVIVESEEEAGAQFELIEITPAR